MQSPRNSTLHRPKSSWTGIINQKRSSTSHQDGNEVYSCANDGIQPYLINPTIDETILDETGRLIGWKAIGSAEGTWLTVVREVAALKTSLSRARQDGGQVGCWKLSHSRRKHRFRDSNKASRGRATTMTKHLQNRECQPPNPSARFPAKDCDSPDHKANEA